MPTVDGPNYRDFLREELLSRMRRNRAYSARALARDIGVSPGYLSQILGGKKSLNEARAHRIAESLAWAPSRRRAFTVLVRSENACDPRVSEAIRSELGGRREISFEKLSEDVFRAISEWHHYAILEVTALEGFVATPTQIARRLALPLAKVASAVKRLRRLGLLTARADGRLAKTRANYSTFDVPSAAIRAFHAQMLGKAASALESQPVEERDFSGIVMAIDPKRIPAARERIREFRRELMEFLEQGERTALYHLSAQLFRLDPAPRSQEKKK
jgi:uncharacterized protein (TIGR02147 family)